MQSRFALTIMGMVFGLLMLWQGFAAADTIEGIVAVVDDRLIMRTDLDARMEALGLDPDDHAKSLKVLDLMVQEIVIEKTYRKFGLPPIDPAQVTAVASQNKTTFDTARAAVMRKTLMDMMVSSRVVVTPQMVKDYYEATPAYSGRVSVHLKQIAVKGDLSKIEPAMAEIKAGKTFDEAAVAHSELLRNGSSDIGWVAIADLHERARTALEKAKPGDILGPVEINDYACIFQVVARELRGKRDLEEVKPEIIDKLEDKLREEAFDHWLKQTTDEHFIGIYL